MPQNLEKLNKRLIRLGKVQKTGDIGLMEELNAVEDKVEEAKTTLEDKMEKLIPSYLDENPIPVEILGIEKAIIQGKDGAKGEMGFKGEKGRDGVDGKDGKDGRDGLDGRDAPTLEEILSQIPIPKDGKDGADGKNGENYVLTDEDKKEIANLVVVQLEERKPDAPVIYGPGKTRIIEIDLSSQLNGVLKTFFLGTHFGIISVEADSAPFGAFRRGVDYNESGKNIVFTSQIDAEVALATGHSLIVRVLK